MTKLLLHQVFREHHTLHDILDHVSDNPERLPFIASVSEAWDEIRSSSTPAQHTMPNKDKLEDAPNKAQKHYTHPLHQQLDRHILDLAEQEGEEDLARIKSCRGFAAHAVFSTLPYAHWSRITSSDFRTIVRFKLGAAQPLIVGQTVCICGQIPDPRGYHYLHCKCGGHRVTSHNSVVRVVDQMVKAAGYFTRISRLPALFPNTPGRKIPDQVVFDHLDNGTMATDTAISYIPRRADLPRCRFR